MQITSECFTRILEGFSRVRRLDPAWALPGLPTLELPLNPVLQAEDLLWFETTYGVTLPDGYRTFLCEICNGGGRAGLDPLGAHVGEGPDCLPGVALAHPCKLSPHMSSAAWAPLAARLEGAHSEAAWQAALSHVFSGLLPVASSGADQLECVVLNGPYAGRIVHLDLQGGSVPHFAVEPDFLSWYWRCRAPAGIR